MCLQVETEGAELKKVFCLPAHDRLLEIL
jgi:hypothetical protein